MIASWSPQVQRVQSLLAGHRYEEAESLVGRMLVNAPEDPALHCLLAQVLLASGRNKDALAATEAALRRAPDQEWPHRLRSIAFHRLGRHRYALAEAQEAVRLGPSTPTCFEALCDAQLGAKLLGDAECTATQLVSLAPEKGSSHSAAGRVALARRNLDLAETYFRRALQLTPDDWRTLHNLAVTLHRAGRRAEAIGLLETAARANPRSQLTRQNLLVAASQYAGIRGLRPVILGLLVVLLSALGLDAKLGVQPRPLVLVAVLAVVLSGLCGLYLLQRRRRAELGATVRTFQQVEFRRRWAMAFRWGRSTLGRRER